MTTAITTRLAAVALTILASTALLAGAVGPAQQGSVAAAARTIA